MSTVNCPNCGVGNHLLPNMKKPKCRKCGKLLNVQLATAKNAAKIDNSPESSEKPSGRTRRRSPSRPSKPKTSKVPEKVGVSPEVSKLQEESHEIDYEV